LYKSILVSAKEGKINLILKQYIFQGKNGRHFFFTATNESVTHVIFFVLILWELIWKGIAPWKATREGQKYWFTVMLLLNTAGILPILYIFIF
jgi:hypothetical protein